MRSIGNLRSAEATFLLLLNIGTVFAADQVVRFIPPNLAYGLSDVFIIWLVLFFSTAGWVLGKFHEAVLWRQGDVVAKARIIQGVIASYISAIFAFWFITPYCQYPLLAGCGASTISAYLGVRAIEVVADLGLEGLKAMAKRYLVPGNSTDKGS